MADTRFVTDYPAIARHRAEQNDEARARYRRLAVTVVVVGLLTAGGAAVSTPLALFVAAIGAGVAFFVALPGGSSVEAGALAGEEGEAAVLERLRTLPDDFTVFNRVRLPDPELPNGWRELDFIVTGPTGLWVVEVKNTPGLVYVRRGERHWPLARRAGCGSRPNWNAMDNPVPQVLSQRRALQRWLLQNGISAEARGVVCLAHPEVAADDADAAEVPVRLRDELVPHLREAATRPAPVVVTDALSKLVAGSSPKIARAI